MQLCGSSCVITVEVRVLSVKRLVPEWIFEFYEMAACRNRGCGSDV